HRTLLDDVQRLPAVARLQGREAGAPQGDGEEATERVVVVDDQDRRLLEIRARHGQLDTGGQPAYDSGGSRRIIIARARSSGVLTFSRASRSPSTVAAPSASRRPASGSAPAASSRSHAASA